MDRLTEEEKENWKKRGEREFNEAIEKTRDNRYDWGSITFRHAIEAFGKASEALLIQNALSMWLNKADEKSISDLAKSFWTLILPLEKTNTLEPFLKQILEGEFKFSEEDVIEISKKSSERSSSISLPKELFVKYQKGLEKKPSNYYDAILSCIINKDYNNAANFYIPYINHLQKDSFFKDSLHFYYFTLGYFSAKVENFEQAKEAINESVTLCKDDKYKNIYRWVQKSIALKGFMGEGKPVGEVSLKKEGQGSVPVSFPSALNIAFRGGPRWKLDILKIFVKSGYELEIQTTVISEELVKLGAIEEAKNFMPVYPPFTKNICLKLGFNDIAKDIELKISAAKQNKKDEIDDNLFNLWNYNDTVGYPSIGEDEKAIRMGEKLLEKSPELRKEPGFESVHRRLFPIFLRHGEYEKAKTSLDYYFEAISSLENNSPPNNSDRRIYLATSAYIYYSLKMYQKAAAFLEEAIIYLDCYGITTFRRDDFVGEEEWHYVLAKLWFLAGNKEKFKESLNKAIDGFLTIGFWWRAAEICVSEFLVNRMENICKEQGEIGYAKKLYEKLAGYLKKLEENEKAGEIYKRIRRLDRPQETTSTKIIKCSMCGKELLPEDSFCMNCGNPVKSGKKICPNDKCRMELPPEAKFCRKCGTPVT